VGHLNGSFAPREGNLNKPIVKSSNARGVARGGMLNFRIDRPINTNDAINLSGQDIIVGIFNEDCEFLN